MRFIFTYIKFPRERISLVHLLLGYMLTKKKKNYTYNSTLYKKEGQILCVVNWKCFLFLSAENKRHFQSVSYINAFEGLNIILEKCTKYMYVLDACMYVLDVDIVYTALKCKIFCTQLSFRYKQKYNILCMHAKCFENKVISMANKVSYLKKYVN